MQGLVTACTGLGSVLILLVLVGIIIATAILVLLIIKKQREPSRSARSSTGDLAGQELDEYTQPLGNAVYAVLDKRYTQPSINDLNDSQTQDDYYSRLNHHQNLATTTNVTQPTNNEIYDLVKDD